VAPPFLTIPTGRNLPKIQQPSMAQPSTSNEKTVADFTRVVEQTGILPPTDMLQADTEPRAAETPSDEPAREDHLRRNALVGASSLRQDG
jgi:hypothetical protein